MNQRKSRINLNVSRHRYGRAVVIGGSLAGLTAARVLSEFFTEVIVIERDRMGDLGEVRNGLPQAHHAHTLQPHGQTILEGLFPGLIEELIDHGAVQIDPEKDIAYYREGQIRRPGGSNHQLTVATSRTMIDDFLFKRVRELSEVDVKLRQEVLGLVMDEIHNRISGVRLRSRENPLEEEQVLSADLVIDASGRGSRSPLWLAELGIRLPEDEIINPFAGYATMIFQKPQRLIDDWKVLYMRPNAPCDTRGGVIIPLDQERWMVTLVGMAGDYPPTSPDEFKDFASSLPSPILYQALEDAEPISDLHSFRRTENRRRRYDRLAQSLNGFLVLGDAAVILNPVYALGMTAAMIGAKQLQNSFIELHKMDSTDLNNLPNLYHQRLDRSLSGLWELVTEEDRKWLDHHIQSQTSMKRLPLPIQAYSLCKARLS